VNTEKRPPRQEQLPASDDIDEIAPGVLRTQLPISIPGLGHVNMYVLEDDRGITLVDPGLPEKASYAAVRKRLAAIGVPLKRVHSVIVTHSHPDHFGGADWLRSETGCDIVTHERFRVMWDPTEPPDVDIDDIGRQPDDHELDEIERMIRDRKPWDPTPWGDAGIRLPPARRLKMKIVRRVPRFARLPRPTVRLADAQHFSFARRDWVAVHTPGHTADHLCLFDPEHGLMLCGDHVLPTITPHIGGLIKARDPLRLFFNSLDKVAAFGDRVKIALPAHGAPFTDLAGRAESIKQHHVERLQKLLTSSRDLGRPATVPEMSTFLFAPRSLGDMANSETFAHLEHLRHTGDMECQRVDGKLEYVARS
jgi:glyoxylase-like metal-dependent hydrolase (beta-lactamase superfamily II)